MAEDEKILDQQEAANNEENVTPQENVDNSSNAEEPQKDTKKSKKDKKSEANAEKEKLSAKEKAQKEWEDSIVANKRVKREITRKKVTKILSLILILSLLLTSIVYVMLLFIEENSIRITATSKDEKTISLSNDGDVWAPVLNVEGPDRMWNISYNPEYDEKGISDQTVPTMEHYQSLISAVSDDSSVTGMLSTKEDNFIAFAFMLKNTSDLSAENININIRMNIEASGKKHQYGIIDAIRVLWIEEYGDVAAHILDDNHTGVYASKTNNQAVIDMQYELFNVTDEEGNKPTEVVEKWAYPMGMVNDADQKFKLDYAWTEEDVDRGFKDTIGFISDTAVFDYESYLVPQEVVRFVVCVWIEGSDFDCNDGALESFVSLSIDFSAY